MARPETRIRLERMDDETRAAFARIDRWFELGQQQHNELRQQHMELRAEMDRRFTALEQELRSLRDWVSAAIADLRSAVQQVLVRLDRLERRHDPFG
jgi:glutathione S-transferase